MATIASGRISRRTLLKVLYFAVLEKLVKSKIKAAATALHVVIIKYTLLVSVVVSFATKKTEKNVGKVIVSPSTNATTSLKDIRLVREKRSKREIVKKTVANAPYIISSIVTNYTKFL